MFFIAPFNINSKRNRAELSFNFLHSACFQRGPACFVRFIKCTYYISVFFWTKYSLISEAEIIFLNRNIWEIVSTQLYKYLWNYQYWAVVCALCKDIRTFRKQSPLLNWIPFSYYLNRSIYISRQTNERAVLNQVI